MAQEDIAMTDQFKYNNFYLATASIIPVLYVALLLQGSLLVTLKRPFRTWDADMFNLLRDLVQPAKFSDGFDFGLSRFLVVLKFPLFVYGYTAVVAVVVASALSEALSLWALMNSSNSTGILLFVFISTLGLLVLMAAPAIYSVLSGTSFGDNIDTAKHPALHALRAANRDEMARRSAPSRPTLRQQPDTGPLNDKACQQFKEIANALREAIIKGAPLARVEDNADVGWTISLNGAELRLVQPKMIKQDPWGAEWQPAFSVVSFSSIHIETPENRQGYKGRSHSLWYCDLFRANLYAWYEIAFMPTDYWIAQIKECPFCLDPGPLAATAMGAGTAEV